jgi:hypothetical protein
VKAFVPKINKKLECAAEKDLILWYSGASLIEYRGYRC